MSHYPPNYGYAYPPQPVVMYQPPPRQSVPPETPHNPVVADSGTKRKRKSESGRRKVAEKGSDDDSASGSDAPRAQVSQPQTQTIVDLKKRTKTVCLFFFFNLYGFSTKVFFSNVLAIRVVVVR